MTLKFIMAGGGTGGHVYPGLAVVERIRESHPDAHIMWIGNPDKIEAKVAPSEGIDFRPIKVSGLTREINPEAIAQNLGALFQAAGAMREAKRLLSVFQPDFAIGTGGYVCGPPLAQASRMGVHTFLIEPNSYPGLTVKWLSRRMDRIFLGSEEAEKYLPGGNCIVTGTPVSKAIRSTKREDGIRAMGLLQGKPCLLVVGGSQGAEKINEAVVEFVEMASHQEPQLLKSIQILHQTGGKGPQALEGLKWEYPDAHYVKVDYINHMAYALAAADVIVSRAGASTLAEIIARGLPPVLIPYPYSAEGHQLKNAHAMAQKDAAVVIEDYQLTGKTLYDAVIPLFKDEAARYLIGEKVKALYNPECLDRIYTEIMSVIEKK